MHSSHQTGHGRSNERGFTVVEMLVTIIILVMVMLGVLAMFEMANRVSRVQVDVADMQQTLRTGQYHVVRMLRLAGRGGLPAQGPLPPLAGPPWPDWTLPTGFAVGVANNVPANTYIDAPATTVKVLQGTDVLTLRGAFSAPVYTLLPETFNLVTDAADPNFGTGSFQLLNIARPGVSAPQTVTPLQRAVTDGVREALVLVSALDDRFYHVVELDPAACVTEVLVDNPDPQEDLIRMTIGFRYTGGTRTAEYWRLSGNDLDTVFSDPTNRRSAAAYMAILEEYRFFVRDVREVAADPNSAVQPQLAQARVFPGTTVPYRGDATNWSVPVSDGVADLQVALGIESGGASLFEPEDLDNAADEWLFNHSDDDPDEARWRNGRLYYVRLTTTSVTSRRDREYRSPANFAVEDHSYAVPDYGTAAALTPDRTYRRRQLRTVVDLRNL